MGAAGFGGSFAPIVQYEKWEIHPVFPHFSYFRLCQKLSPNLLAPLCGVALEISKTFEKSFSDRPVLYSIFKTYPNAHHRHRKKYYLFISF